LGKPLAIERVEYRKRADNTLLVLHANRPGWARGGGKERQGDAEEYCSAADYEPAGPALEIESGQLNTLIVVTRSRAITSHTRCQHMGYCEVLFLRWLGRSQRGKR